MNLGPMELVIILAIALLLFGPSRLPGLGKSLGDAIRGFKKGMEGEPEKDAQLPKDQITDASASDATTSKQKDKTEA
jgi:sec-independent protein translocase protein TatA